MPQNPENLLWSLPLAGVAESLKRQRRGSERVLEMHSLLTLKMVRNLYPP
jgi:hypothetical protein